VPTHLQWGCDGELHPDELAELQSLLVDQLNGPCLEFQALSETFKPLQEDQESQR
jgi:hypothetical protein